MAFSIARTGPQPRIALVLHRYFIAQLNVRIRKSAILVETEKKVVALQWIARLIADAGIMIYYFYSMTSTGRMASCVIKTADDKKAMKVLQTG